MKRVLLMALALAACGQSAPDSRRGSEAATQAFKQGFTGPIVDLGGRKIGTIAGTPGEKGLVVRFEVTGLAPGPHAIHLHSAGRCEPPGFDSSGPHWNPAGRQHGLDNPRGAHDGDWDNLEVAPDGSGRSDRMIPRWHNKIPESGLSLVIHAGKDDERTDPDGNSGERIACGVVIPPA